MEDGIPNEIYRKHILELYKNPSNFGSLKNASHSHTETNFLCGDEITIQLIVDKEKIRNVKFHGSGCVISLVSASLLTDKIKGMEVSSVKKLDKGDILNLLGINVNPARLKCALLPLYAVKKSLK